MNKRLKKKLDFRYPLKLETGQLFGIYEIMFVQQSMFSYKAGK